MPINCIENILDFVAVFCRCGTTSSRTISPPPASPNVAYHSFLNTITITNPPRARDHHSSRDHYSYITDFKFYVTVLVSLSKLHGTKLGNSIAGEIMNVAMRVLPVRGFVVTEMVELIVNSSLVMGKSDNTILEVLRAAAFVVGEFSGYIKSDENNKGGENRLHHKLISTMIDKKTLGLDAKTQHTYVQSLFKIFASACSR